MFIFLFLPLLFSNKKKIAVISLGLPSLGCPERWRRETVGTCKAQLCSSWADSASHWQASGATCNTHTRGGHKRTLNTHSVFPYQEPCWVSNPAQTSYAVFSEMNRVNAGWELSCSAAIWTKPNVINSFLRFVPCPEPRVFVSSDLRMK